MLQHPIRRHWQAEAVLGSSNHLFYGTANTPSNLAITAEIQRRLDKPVGCSTGNHYLLAVHLQFLQLSGSSANR
jgi:hypothetical protein